MSNVAIEETQGNCQADLVLQGRNVAVGSLSYMDTVFQMQSEAAFDELGDSLVEGEESVLEAQKRAGTRLPKDTARSIFRAVSGCLQQRYLGNCAVAGNCSGRDFVDNRLSQLSISRYKALEEA